MAVFLGLVGALVMKYCIFAQFLDFTKVLKIMGKIEEATPAKISWLTKSLDLTLLIKLNKILVKLLLPTTNKATNYTYWRRDNSLMHVHLTICALSQKSSQISSLRWFDNVYEIWKGAFKILLKNCIHVNTSLKSQLMAPQPDQNAIKETKNMIRIF